MRLKSQVANFNVTYRTTYPYIKETRLQLAQEPTPSVEGFSTRLLERTHAYFNAHVERSKQMDISYKRTSCLAADPPLSFAAAHKGNRSLVVESISIIAQRFVQPIPGEHLVYLNALFRRLLSV